MNHFIDMVNASKIYTVRSTWGYKNSTTNMYSGMIGDAQTGITDIAGKVSKRCTYYYQERTKKIP